MIPSFEILIMKGAVNDPPSKNIRMHVSGQMIFLALMRGKIQSQNASNRAYSIFCPRMDKYMHLGEISDCTRLD
jgi:hypothetical protein